ncbi:hypothetical protein B7C62_08770 [Kitasatospora albolonga]|uniref:Uncharacterized protein n=1 Tax=Kitasatospora albolonga TaxID=68173 RepID=A0ABC8BQC6_9ACTN|nr:hypothetical protein B7C62_08770 [Kitasatospora albolonga]
MVKLSDVLIMVAAIFAAAGLSVLLGDGWAGMAVGPFLVGIVAVIVGSRIKERRKRRNSGGWR